MNTKSIRAAAFVLLLLIVITMLCGCGKNDALTDGDEASGPAEKEEAPAEKLSEEQALSAIRNYCISANPDLEDIVKREEYPVYWEISSSDENEIAVLFRSYTGSLSRYHIDRTTGDTYVTEYVPGVTGEEQRTDESFNARDHLTL